MNRLGYPASLYPKSLPTKEEIAARPELCKLTLRTVADRVDNTDIEHVVVIGMTPDGGPSVYHTYGQDLSLTDVADLLENLAVMARKQAKQ